MLDLYKVIETDRWTAGRRQVNNMSRLEPHSLMGSNVFTSPQADLTVFFRNETVSSRYRYEKEAIVASDYMTIQVGERAERCKLSDALDEAETYPTVGTYTWGEFAGLVIEAGGYNDLTIINPYTGRRLWLADALQEGDFEYSIYDAARRIIALAEKLDFMGEDPRFKIGAES